MSGTLPDERIAVIGMGYVGLPLALDLAEAGHRVLGIEASPERLARLRAGDSYVDDVPGGRLQAALAAGSFRLGDTSTAWTDESVAFICVPTPVTASREPDLGPVPRAPASTSSAASPPATSWSSRARPIPARRWDRSGRCSSAAACARE